MNNPPLILIVDDEAELLTIYSLKLKGGGFATITAADGVECLAIAKEKHPDLILLDVKMPVKDGIETFTDLQKDPTTKDIKVIFLTAFSDPTTPDVDVKLAHEIGADFIKKGISLDEFLKKIQMALGR